MKRWMLRLAAATSLCLLPASCDRGSAPPLAASASELTAISSRRLSAAGAQAFSAAAEAT